MLGLPSNTPPLGSDIPGVDGLSGDRYPTVDLRDCDPNSVLFKHDRMYRHKLIRINYTTYDVQRGQDVVNSSTSHCNIMVLADHFDDGPSTSNYKFKYARVLGVYHVNVVYVGHGMTDYQPRRMEFLWVRWYQDLGLSSGWDAKKLDSVHFPPIDDAGSFGFVDPSDVLRACHIIPSFTRGQVHCDGKGLSLCARDSSDWRKYYVDR